MIERARELLQLDLEQIDLRRGLMGMIAVVATLVFVAAFGIAGLAAGLGALFVVAADMPGLARERVAGVLILTIGGTLVGLVGVWAGTEHAWISICLTLGVTAVGTVAAGFGNAAALRGLLLTLWAILALSLSGAGESAGALAAAFALGVLLAAPLLWLRGKVGDDGRPEAASSGTASGSQIATIATIVRSPLGWFALLRGAAVALATGLGILLFPVHPIWAALTVLLVLRPRADEAVATGLLRTLGTLGGVLVAEAVGAIAGGSDAGLTLAFLAAAFATTALQRVNYAVFVLFLTAGLVLMQQLLGRDAAQAAEDRLLATMLGAGIAFATLALGRVIVRHGSPERRPTE